MAKRNLLSKLIAGVLAAGMVVTMLPGMSLRSEAANNKVTIHKVGYDFGGDAQHNNLATFGGNFKVIQIDADTYNEGMDSADVKAAYDADVATWMDNTAWDSTKDFNPSDATIVDDFDGSLYLLLVPDMYYEFKNGPVGTSDAVTDGARFTPKENTKDTRWNSWMMKISNVAVVNSMNISSVSPIELVVRVEVGDGISAAQTTGRVAIRDSASLGDGKTMEYVLFRDERLGTGYTYKPGTQNPATDNMLSVVGMEGDVHQVSSTDDRRIASAQLQLVSGNSDERRITIDVAKSTGSSEMDMKINGTSIEKHRLVSQKVLASVTGTGVDDTNKYVELGTNAPTSDLLPRANTKGANPDYQYDNPIEDGNALFSIWWENLWALYFHGYANAAVASKVGTSTYKDNVDARVSNDDKGMGYFVKDAQGRRVLTISFGGTIKKGNVTFVNGGDLSGSSVLPSIYNRKYVFRDENGKRFYSTEKEKSSFSADGKSYTLEGFTQGDELKFTIKYDTAYNESRVYLVDKNKVATDITNLKGEDGVFTVKLGDGFPYEIIADEPTTKALRKVVNMPEADAVYSPGHNDYLQEYVALGTLPMYTEDAAFFTAWNRNAGSCNVQAPRYQFYLQANEEDDVYMNLFPFANPRAVGTKDDDYLGFNFPVGTYKFKVRFANSFVTAGHGVFDDVVANDRYTAGPDFKITQDGTELKPDENGLYTLTVTEGDDPIILKTENIARTYRVYAPNLAAYNIDANYDLSRENYDFDVNTDLANNFRATVPEGETFSFKIEPSEGTQKGPDFKVYLRAAGDDLDRDGSVVMTEIKEGTDGSYSFTVYNDTEIVVSGMSGTGFNDVNNRSAEEQEAINYLKDAGVLEGYDDGSFRPGNNLTRGEFVTMLQRLQKGNAGTASFSDTSGHWAAGAIGWASGQSVVNGYPDGSFRPNASISRAEVSQIMWKLNGSQRANMVAPFSDVNQGAWYAPAVNWNFEKGIIKGYGDGKFGTNEPIERAHMALILYRAR